MEEMSSCEECPQVLMVTDDELELTVNKCGHTNGGLLPLELSEFVPYWCPEGHNNYDNMEDWEKLIAEG